MRKLTPIMFSEEESVAIQEQLGVQEVQRGTPKSLDPINFPVFTVPVNKKVLVYVPNHTVQDADGVDRLRMDMPLIHSVTVGRQFLSYRCTSGLVNENHGLDGSCPLCIGKDDPWDLAYKIIDQKCKVQGLDPKDTDNADVKAIRSAAFSDRAVKDASRHYTFPIVVFDTLNDDGKTLIKDEEGNLKYTIYWYDCSENTWEDKWVKVLEGMEDEPTHPGGRFFMLNYIYKTKPNEQPNARDAARNVTISARTVSGSEKLREYLDKQTEEWTPVKAQRTVLANIIYSNEDLQSVADEALVNTRSLLALYEGVEGAGAVGTTADGFNLKKIEKADSGEDVSGALPIETDMDE